MRAVVLAAGKGSRLGATTTTIPKPMIPVRGRPVLEHNLRWLASHGVDEVAINLHHLPEVITGHFGDGAALGLRIRYSPEEELLGTAGGVRRIARTLWGGAGEPFLVIYGDNLLNYDLGELQAFHRRAGGLGTILVYTKDDVSHSGIVATDPDGRIQRFIEKPRPDQVVSHLVNTGVYLLEPGVVDLIPPGDPRDFGRDVFPAMVAAGHRLYALELPGSLTPIDTPEMLREATGQEGAP